MSAGDFLARLVVLLDGAGIPYMVAGSFASTFHGVARAPRPRLRSSTVPADA